HSASKNATWTVIIPGLPAPGYSSVSWRTETCWGYCEAICCTDKRAVSRMATTRSSSRALCGQRIESSPLCWLASSGTFTCASSPRRAACRMADTAAQTSEYSSELVSAISTWPPAKTEDSRLRLSLRKTTSSMRVRRALRQIDLGDLDFGEGLTMAGEFAHAFLRLVFE